ncbi:MAG: aromatic acid exporter family protein [bacterium]
MFEKNKLIFWKSFKIWLAAISAIVVAESLHLQFSVACGIVAILSVASTKKETLKTAINRFFAFAVALGISFIIYNIFGYTIMAFCIYLFFFIVICIIMKWENAMAMNSVLISHFLTFQDMSLQHVLNEVLLFVIGVTFAIIVNLHLRKKTEYMNLLRNETDEQIKIVLERMSEKILVGDIKDYNGGCFKKLNASVNKAKLTAQENYMNQFSSSEAEKWDIEYILMREQQINTLFTIYKYIVNIKSTPNTTKPISDYLKKISIEFNADNSAIELLDELHILMQDLRTTELPKSREEFEDRARLYLIMSHLEEFLLLKVEFKNKF